MKKTMTVFLFFLLLGWLACPAAYAEDRSADALLERIEKLEHRQGLFSHPWMQHIAISGVLEAEAGYVRTDYKNPANADTDETDVVLATMELGVDADLTDYVSGHMVFLWEEDDTEPVDLDTGFITVSGGDRLPVYVNLGKMYLPFGIFESFMISDSLTLELAETRESAIQAGFAINGFYGAAFIFNGDIDESGKDSRADNFGASIGIAVEDDAFSMDLSAGYINNILDSDGLGDHLSEIMETDETALDDDVAGVAAAACFSMGPVTLIGEYITALDKPTFFSVSDGVAVTGQKMSAFNAELACTFACCRKETTLGVAYQESDNTGDLLPDTRWAGTLSAGILSGTTLALEYCRDKFENDDQIDRVTAQLALEF